MTISENETPVPADKWARQNHVQNWPHVAIVGGMIISLGTAIITGLKKAKGPHAIASLSFVGFALTHFFMHQKQLSNRVKKGIT